MTQFAVFGDLHLKPHIKQAFPDLQGDAYHYFNEAIDLCLELKIPAVIPGDIFDNTHPDWMSAAVFRAGMDKMREAELQVFFGQGNHDYHPTHPGPVALHNWPMHYHNLNFQLGPWKCFGLDWRPGNIVKEAFKEVPEDADILFTHQCWTEFMKHGSECSFADVHYAHTVISGDYHATEFKDAANADGEPLRVWSPGSSCMIQINEPSQKYVLLVADDGTGTPKVTPHHIQTRPFYMRGARDEAQFEQELLLLAQVADQCKLLKLPEHIRTPMIRFCYHESIVDAKTRIDAVAKEHPAFVWLDCEREDRTEAVDVSDTASFINQAGALEQLVPAGRMRDDVSALLNTHDVSVVMKQIESNFFRDLEGPDNI
jgi:hypothetical protein